MELAKAKKSFETIVKTQYIAGLISRPKALFKAENKSQAALQKTSAAPTD